MRTKTWKGVFGALLCCLLLTALLPGGAMAAGVSVAVGSTQLTEGVNEIGGGTATLDSAAETLTLENVTLTSIVRID